MNLTLRSLNPAHLCIQFFFQNYLRNELATSVFPYTFIGLTSTKPRLICHPFQRLPQPAIQSQFSSTGNTVKITQNNVLPSYINCSKQFHAKSITMV